MTKPGVFRVGDRVAVYESGIRYERTIADVHGNAVSLVSGIGPNNVKYVHPKQCHKIGPKKRREWTLGGGVGGDMVLHGASQLGGGEEVRVREVKK